MIEIKNVTKIYKDKTVGVKNINLTFPDRGLIVIEGKSGSGKSTLLNLISGIMSPTEGMIYYNNVDIKNVRNYKDYVGMIFQDYNLISDLNVLDNINFIGKGKTDELISLLGLEKLSKKKTHEISGGEARRVAIARALNKGVKILLCDEPTESLDKVNEENILNVLKKISEDILVVVVSHKDAVRKYADRIITISKSSIVEDKHVNEKEEATTDIKSKTGGTKLLKLIKIGLTRIFDNLGLFTLNLSALCLVFVLFLMSLVLKEMDLNKIEVEAMERSSEHRIVIEFYNGSKASKKMISDLNIPYNEVYSYFLVDQLLKFDLGHQNGEIGAFYLSDINIPQVVFINENTFLRSDEIVGRLPSHQNEIVISEYTFEGFKKFGVKTADGDFVVFSNIDDILGKSLLLGGKEVIITGVLKQNIEDYEAFKNVTIVSGYDQEVFFSMFTNSITKLNYIYVTDEFDSYIEYKNKSLNSYLVNSEDKDVLYKAKSLDDKLFETKGIYTGNLISFKKLIKRLKIFGNFIFVIFIIIGIVLISNYFSNSIENHEKDNRILKYLNLSNLEMFIPYLFESIILMVTSSLVGIIIVSIISSTLNNFYKGMLYSDIALFNLSLNNIISLFIFILSIIVVLSFFNIFKINKSIKKYTE